MSASVSRVAESRTAVKVARCPRARRRARRKSCSLERRGSAQQWRSCNWASTRLTKSRRRTVRQQKCCMKVESVRLGNSRKGNKECNPSIGYGHRLRGEVRAVAKGGKSFGKGCGGRHGEGRRGGSVPRYRCRRDVPRQGVRVAASAIPINATHAQRLREERA
eukprot:6180342-Pleurochrysis_carterae.AAC.3